MREFCEIEATRAFLGVELHDRVADMHVLVEAPDGARQQLAVTVAALQRPAAYSSDACRVESIETHMSWVFLTEAFAYKLKKPIRTPHLDYTTIEKRRHACETELALNRRLAREIYLKVVPVVCRQGGIRVAAEGVPIDWLVKMRRLPRDRMLDVRLERRSLESVDVDPLVATLVPFYEAAARARFRGPTYRQRIASDIESKATSLAQPRYGLAQESIELVIAGQRRWLDRHGKLLESRASNVVDAHGDLRPEHICLEPRPVVIDCLDFDRELRLLDPVSELSFLALECTRLGGASIGRRLLERYAEMTGDRVPSTLISFYQSVHAIIRAAVAIWHVDDDALDHSDSWRERAGQYLELARELLSGAAD